MCFIVEKRRWFQTKKPRVAKKDIICYKVMIPCNDNLYRSPFMSQFKSSLGVEILPELMGLPIEGDYAQQINHGLHSKSTYNTAIDLQNELDNSGMGYETRYVILQCRIPKGTKFYQNKKYCEYVAEKMIYDRELPKHYTEQ